MTCSDATSERHAASNVYKTLDDFTPFRHDPEQWKAKLSAVVLTGSSGNTNKVAQSMYFSLSKQYYARRHGYKFMYSLSEQFTSYYHRDLWKVARHCSTPC